MHTIQVVAAVLRDAQGRVLINCRPTGKPMAGFWEFPGGKLESGETAMAALVRELHEELGIEVQAADSWLQLEHSYPDRRVALDVWRVRRYQGLPVAREQQVLAWARPEDLSGYQLLPADAPIVTALRWPLHMLVTPAPGADHEAFLAYLEQALQRGVEFVQLRMPELPPAEYSGIARRALALARRYAARVVLNQAPDMARELCADGVHLNGARLQALHARPLPGGSLVGASCHDLRQIEHALAVGVDYLVLGPVLATPTHPGIQALGWEKFAGLAAASPVPVYAIGGMTAASLAKVRESGGHGIAAMRALWGG